MKLYTVGHSNRSLDELVGELRRRGIEVLIDVRSSPYSRYAVQFNQAALESGLGAVGIRYLFAGGPLGGRPREAALYEHGQASYAKMRETYSFQQGIEELCDHAQRRCAAIMCSEGQADDCHRGILIAPAVAEHFEVIHIGRDGLDERHDDMVQRLIQTHVNQLDLFDAQPTDPEEYALNQQAKRIAFTR